MSSGGSNPPKCARNQQRARRFIANRTGPEVRGQHQQNGSGHEEGIAFRGYAIVRDATVSYELTHSELPLYGNVFNFLYI